MEIARDLPTDLTLRSLIDQVAAPALLITPDLYLSYANRSAVNALSDVLPTQSGAEGIAAGCSLRDILHQNVDWLRVATALSCHDHPQAISLPDTDQTMVIIPIIGASDTIMSNLGIIIGQKGDVEHQSQRWQTILSSLDDGIWDYDAITNTRYRSDGWRRLRGLAPGDDSRNSRKAWRTHVHPDDLPCLDRTHADVLAGRLHYFDVTYRERHAEGHWIWIRSVGKVTRFDDNGLPLHVVASNSDVTEAKQAEDRLADLEQLRKRWVVSVESAGQGLWDHNFKTGTRYYSDTWRALRGLSKYDHSREDAENWLLQAHPDDQTRLREEMDRISTGLTDEIRHEYRVLHKAGHYIWILRRGRVVSRDEKGKPEHVIGNDTDITTIKSNTEALENITKTLEMAVTVAGIGVWEHNLATGVTTWDPQMYDIYGLADQGRTPIGDLWEKHLHPDDYDQTTAQAARCLATGTELNQDYRIIRPDNTIRYVRCRAAQVLDQSGARRFIGLTWDITDDHARAEVLRHAHLLAQEQNAALEAARAEMEHSALHDALTGLANRRKLDDFEKSLTGRATVLNIDLDRFKHINDTLGHAAGDQLLIHVARIFEDHAPDDALVARVGGDEFAIILPHTPPHGTLRRLASQMIAATSEPVIIEGHECRFGISIGIASAASNQGGSSLFAKADMALYQAKNDGRGRYRFFTDDLQIALHAKNKLSDDILAGLENGEFYCVYQPQFNAHTLELSGVEALVRWRHSDGTHRSPDAFLPTAEELNVVEEIDQIVLDQAIADTLAMHAAGLPVPRMSVNVSARRLVDPTLPDKLACLAQAPGEFAFELLESVFLDAHNDQLAANVAAIRGLGVDIEVDDFGTGHASIVGLLKLNPDRLKIDRQLVGPVVTSAKQRQLVKSIVEIGKLQGIAVVAEGVETAEHIDVLRDLGCDHLQGYGLARPMPCDALVALMRAAKADRKCIPHHKQKHR